MGVSPKVTPDDDFGPYTTPRALSGVASAGTDPLFMAALAGAGGGALTAVLGGFPYWLVYRGTDVELSWGKVGVVFVAFIVATGALVCVMLRMGVSLTDRWVGARPVLSALGCVPSGALFGALAGVLPGSFGTAYFGSVHAPFMGTAMLSLAPLAGALLASTSLAVVDRRAAKARVVPVLGMAVLATLAFAAVGAILCVLVNDDAMLDAFRAGSGALSDEASSPERLARVGALAGAILGVFVGSHIGATLALSRLVFPTLPPTQRNPTPSVPSI